MTRSMQAIVPQHATLTPPEGSVPAGQTPEGIPLHRLTQMRSRSVPDLDKNGKQRWALHPQNNMPLIPLRKPEIYEFTRLFYQESDGQFNVSLVDYKFPTKEELAAEKRTLDVAEMKDSFAEAMVDEGISPAAFLAALKSARGEPAAPVEEVEEAEEVKPEAVKAEADTPDESPGPSAPTMPPPPPAEREI